MKRSVLLKGDVLKIAGGKELSFKQYDYVFVLRFIDIISTITNMCYFSPMVQFVNLQKII